MKEYYCYQEVRYEELIGAPAESMANVFFLLGLDAGAAENPPGVKTYTHRDKIWRASMGKEDRLVFAREAGDLLIELGYERNDEWARSSA